MDSRVLRQEVVWIPPERRVPFVAPPWLPGVRVWTLYDFTDPNVKPELPYNPVHHVNAFLEDYVHDWNVNNGVFRYYSRAVRDKVWVLIEYMEPPKPCGRRPA